MGGARITYEHEGAVTPREIEPFLLGSCMAVVLHMRCTPVLHAAALVRDTHGFLVCGKSGAGKSTTSARLVLRGAQILSDDVSVLSGEESFEMLPGYPQSKLLPDAFGSLEMHGRATRPLPFESDKLGVDLSRDFASAPVPLRAIFLLRIVDGEPARVRRVAPQVALSALFRLIYRREFLDSAGNAAAMTALGRLVAQVPVHHLGRPADEDSTDFVVRTIEGIMADLAQTPVDDGELRHG